MDGKLIEKFFIDNKEVSESTYYSLLEEKLGIPYNNISNAGSKSQPNTVKSKELNDLSIKQEEYIENLLSDIYDNPEDAFYILENELIFNFKVGYHTGQIDLNNNYAKAMKYNYRITQSNLDNLLDDYNKE